MASSRDNLLVARFAVPEFDSKAHGVALDWNEKIALVHCKNFMKALRANGLNVHKHNPRLSLLDQA